jgi:starvation-inducible DNA-binding protein
MHNKIHTPLKVFVADCSMLLSQAQGFHWNIIGPDFFDLHDFFKTVYESLFEAVDDFAERLRALESIPPYDLHEINSLTTIPALSRKDLIQGADAAHIYADHSARIIASAKKLCKLCEECDDHTTQDMLLDFIQEQEKFSWMIKSFLG